MPFFILMIIISMGVALFAVQNPVSVSLNFVFWSFTSSLVLVILGSFLLGLIVATFFMLMMKARHYLADKKMREDMAALEAEKKRLEEKIAMLQHTQMMHDAARNQAQSAKDAAAKQSVASNK